MSYYDLYIKVAAGIHWMQYNLGNVMNVPNEPREDPLCLEAIHYLILDTSPHYLNDYHSQVCLII